MADTLIAFRVDTKTVEKLKKAAKQEDRTVSSYLRQLLQNALKETKK